MIYFLLSTAFCIGGLVIIYWLHNHYHLDIIVEPTAPPSTAPFLSICVPARNEERNILACVKAILNQDYPNFEIIVLDDRSTDSTLWCERFNRIVSEKAPLGLTLVLMMRPAPSAQWLPKEMHGKPMVAIRACCSGRPEEGAKVVAPIKSFGKPIGDVLPA